MAKTPQVGEEAPDFELAGTDGSFKLSEHRGERVAPDFDLAGTDGSFELSEHRGERVVLLFYPGDRTMVCTKQFCSYRDRTEDFNALGATVGDSAQDVASHDDFVAKNSLTVPLLADVGGAVAKQYGAWGDGSAPSGR